VGGREHPRGGIDSKVLELQTVELEMSGKEGVWMGLNLEREILIEVVIFMGLDGRDGGGVTPKYL
jgi:hypothetical protein